MAEGCEGVIITSQELWPILTTLLEVPFLEEEKKDNFKLLTAGILISILGQKLRPQRLNIIVCKIWKYFFLLHDF